MNAPPYLYGLLTIPVIGTAALAQLGDPVEEWRTPLTRIMHEA